MGKRKDSVSLNARIGTELFDMLDGFCQRTGQPKTVAVERALRAYCDGSASLEDAGPLKETNPPKAAKESIWKK